MELGVMRKSALAAVVAVGAMMSGQAMAAPSLTFDDDDQDQDGTVTHAAGGPAIGSGIDFVGIKGDGTPDNDGVTLDCVGCELSFTTGDLITQGPTIWEWGPGGSFVLSGTAQEQGGGAVVASGDLLTGTFSSAVAVGNLNSITFNGFGTDSKDIDLLTYFGIDSDFADNFVFANTTLSLASATIEDDGSFEATVTNADLDNTVPVPATLGLLGLGLIGLGVVSRRRG